MIIGIFSSSVLTFVGALVSYFYRKNHIFYKINTFIDDVYMTFNSQIVIVNEFNVMEKVKALFQLNDEYKNIIKYFSEYKTFFKFGYHYKQAKQIHELMINELNKIVVIILVGNNESVSDYYNRIEEAYTLYENTAKSKVTELHKCYTENIIKRLKRKKLLDKDFKMNYFS